MDTETQKVREIIERQNPNIKDYINKHDFGRMTPIPTIFMAQDNVTRVCMSKSVATQLLYIAQQQNLTDTEQSYFIHGYESGDGKLIVLDKLYFSNKGLQQYHQNISDDMLTYLSNYATVAEQTPLIHNKYKRVFIVGHTHPVKGSYYMNPSLGDLDQCFTGIKGSNLFDSHGIDVATCMLTGDGQLVMFYYQGGYFFKINNVYVKEKEEYITFDEHFHKYKEQNRQINENNGIRKSH